MITRRRAVPVEPLEVRKPHLETELAMAGIGALYKVIPKQVFSAPMSSALPLTTWVAKGIDAINFTAGTLIVRIHAGTNITAGTGLLISVFGDAPTAEDHNDFIPNNAALATYSVTNTSVTNEVYFQAFAGGPIPGFLRVQLQWPTSSAGQAIISVDLSLKGT